MWKNLVLTAALAGGCTRNNPGICCETDEECARVGFDAPRRCLDGACVGNVCVDEGACDGDEDCDAPAICRNSACSLATCSTDPETNCRQVLEEHCKHVGACGGSATQCAEQIESICPTNSLVLTDENCVHCRTLFAIAPCDDTTTYDGCLACYGLAAHGGSSCPQQ